jgi:dishevelled associated activator of morphogenesis
MIIRILSLVLSIGNYMNGGTSRGRAYGVKVDVLKKLMTIKAEGADRGTLVHFIANIALNRAPELLIFSDDWTAAWASSEITLKDLENDIKRLGQQRDRVQNELSNGHGVVLKEAGEAMAKPLKSRLDWFLCESEKQLKETQELKAKAQSDVMRLVEFFGESASADSTEDSVQIVLDPLLSFAKSFKQAVDEISAQRRKAEKAAAAQAALERERTLKQQAIANQQASVDASGKRKSVGKAKENIFANFNNAKAASTESVVAEFKLRLKNRSAGNA